MTLPLSAFICSVTKRYNLIMREGRVWQNKEVGKERNLGKWTKEATESKMTYEANDLEDLGEAEDRLSGSNLYSV